MKKISQELKRFRLSGIVNKMKSRHSMFHIPHSIISIRYSLSKVRHSMSSFRHSIKNSRKLKYAIIIFICILLGGLAAFKLYKIFFPPFGKGVLVLNMNKSEYMLKDSVLFQIATLDSKGQTLCNSSLKMEITAPGEKKPIILTTADGNIITTSTCSTENNVTNEADYIVRYKTDKTGKYSIKLTNLDTKKSIKSIFTIYDNKPDFVIERLGATRINPFKADRYSMSIIITANKDFDGNVVESVPSDFEIIWYGPASIKEADKKNEYKKLTWVVNIKKGQSKKLAYDYQIPQKSPDLIAIKPLSIDEKTYGNSWFIVACTK